MLANTASFHHLRRPRPLALIPVIQQTSSSCPPFWIILFPWHFLFCDPGQKKMFCPPLLFSKHFILWTADWCEWIVLIYCKILQFHPSCSELHNFVFLWLHSLSLDIYVSSMFLAIVTKCHNEHACASIWMFFCVLWVDTKQNDSLI